MSAELAECYLHRLTAIGKSIKYTQQLIDGTLGRTPLAAPVAAVR